MEGVGVGEVIADKFLSDERTFSVEMFGASHGGRWWRWRGTTGVWLTGVTTLHCGEETVGQCPDSHTITHCTARSKQTVLCQETPLDTTRLICENKLTLRLTSSLNKHQWTPITVTMPGWPSQTQVINKYLRSGGRGWKYWPAATTSPGSNIWTEISMSEYTISELCRVPVVVPGVQIKHYNVSYTHTVFIVVIILTHNTLCSLQCE